MLKTIPSSGEPSWEYCPKAYCILKTLFCKCFMSNYQTKTKHNTLGCEILRIIAWKDCLSFMLSKNKRGFNTSNCLSYLHSELLKKQHKRKTKRKAKKNKVKMLSVNKYLPRVKMWPKPGITDTNWSKHSDFVTNVTAVFVSRPAVFLTHLW